MSSQEKPMEGKVCMVTGATRGLGEAAAIGLARHGAKVFVVGRNPVRLQATLDRIQREAGNGSAEGILADLSGMAEVRRVAEEFLTRGLGLDVLINNVGATTLQYQQSPDRLEMTWALNYLSHFLLTNLLLPALRRAAIEHGEARVLELVSSMFRYASPRMTRIQQERGYNGVMAYAQSKRALMMFTAEMADRLKGSGVAINAFAPGFVRTGIAEGNGFFAGIAMQVVTRFSVSLEEGILPLLKMVEDPALRGVSGAYFYVQRRKDTPKAFGSREDRAYLWRISEEAGGLV